MNGKVALVTPWFGADLRGGAEQQSWQLAHHFASAGIAIDVLTTCCPSFTDDWGRNRLQAGAESRGFLTVWRFPVDRRDKRAFDRVNATLLAVPAAALKPSVSPIGADDEAIFARQNINSTQLVDHLAANGRDYSAVIFLPYLYGTTLNGLPVVAERAYLQPCLHDEPYAYLPRVKELVHAARGLLFNSEGEFELALRIFGPGIHRKSRVVGEGVDVLRDRSVYPRFVGAFHPERESYVLYLGRQDPEKNIWGLVRAFNVYRRHHPFSRLKLVVAGERRGPSFGDAGKDIVDLGPVTEEQKAALLSNCRALAQPSLNESYSRVIIEAWLHGRPVIVNAFCEATATAVRKSGGGYCAGPLREWERVLERVDLAGDADLAEIGNRGREYAEDHGAWSAVVQRYREVLGSHDTLPEPPPVHQVVAPTDSLALDYAERLALALRLANHEATLYPKDPARDALEVRHIRSVVPANGTAERMPDVVVYHASEVLAAGPQACPADAAVFGATPGMVRALRDSGRRDATFLPICVDPRQWDGVDDAYLARALQDGKKNFVYVGPFRESGAMHSLVLAFLHLLQLEREARLVLVGDAQTDAAVHAKIASEVQSLDLTDTVLVAADITRPQLQSIYATADVFLSLDELDGYGTAFLEAMWFDIPIAAYKSAVAAELVGDCGILFTDRDDPVAVAALSHMLATDPDLRAPIIAAQRRKRARYDSEATARRLLECARVPV